MRWITSFPSASQPPIKFHAITEPPLTHLSKTGENPGAAPILMDEVNTHGNRPKSTEHMRLFESESNQETTGSEDDGNGSSEHNSK
jgi:hypothetical protein